MEYDITIGIDGFPFPGKHRRIMESTFCSVKISPHERGIYQFSYLSSGDFLRKYWIKRINVGTDTDNDYIFPNRLTISNFFFRKTKKKKQET